MFTFLVRLKIGSGQTLILDMPLPASTETMRSLAGSSATGVKEAMLVCNSQGSRQLQAADDTTMELLLQPPKKLIWFLNQSNY